MDLLVNEAADKPNGIDAALMDMKPKVGFTLIELMIIVAIAAILLTVAAPGFRGVIDNSRTTAITNDIVGALNLARSEAVKRGRTMSLCPSTTGTACSGSWPQGWILFVDENANGVWDLGTDEILRVWPSMSGNPVITTNATHIGFNNTGSSSANAATVLTLSLPGCQGPHARTITVAPGGRVSTTRIDCP